MDKRIGIVGYGYVGQAMAKLFAKRYKIRAYDADKLAAVPYDRAYVVASKVQKEQINECDLGVICVPTPMREDGACDVSIVEEVIDWLKTPLILIKSTVPPGFTDRMRLKTDKRIVFSPEYCGESSYWSSHLFHEDVIETPWFTFGGDARDTSQIIDYFLPVCGPEKVYHQTTAIAAEMAKYMENVFYAAKVALCHEFAEICNAVGCDYHQAREAWLLDPRINRMHTAVFDKDGPPFSGKCLPKDTNALIKIFQDNHLTARIVEAVVQVNDAQKSHMIKKIRDALGGNLYGKTIAVLGLTFKPETDDMREAPSLTIIPALQENGAKIRATDPQGIEESKKMLSQVEYFDDPYKASEGADATIIMTEWNEYRALNLERLKRIMKGIVFVDLRNVYNEITLHENGFEYIAVGM